MFVLAAVAAIAYLRHCYLQASFSAASHGSLDSVDDDVDFQVDDKLKAQIEQMSFQRREENTLEQIEVRVTGLSQFHYHLSSLCCIV